MPGLLQKNAQLGTQLSVVGSVSGNGIWSKQRGDITFDQLQKFWSELVPHARQELLRIDKQTLFEQARKNLYCSRCNGLLLEGFSQIVIYGKSLQQEGANGHRSGKQASLNNLTDNGVNNQDDVQDPSVHPWGGLAATRDGILTLMDCFLYGKSLKELQNVFDSARVRERERELLYPDACGGGGRGWISQGMATYGRGHGTRETCALHTASLSCDTLVDFWSALGDETQLSLLRMKEEDFIERLMYRFDSKRFCRDCRKNVIREFKELKELKRMRREPCCTNWFCVADTAFQYEVSRDTVQADWHQYFTDAVGSYHHFEWAVGTGEGKADILEFEDVGMNGNVRVDGLDLGGLKSCFITLRAWKLDGRCTELSVKAHALKGQPCVHCRLIVGDGFVTITKGESIRKFFEHAEEAEEEEDDDSVDKDGNDIDGDGSRPQKHAKSPELAREFLLDAATVIFKEQVEKAFREGTARQNAHSIFVYLALKLLEERVHVACKEIITLEKQVKLLEEDEREKRDEEERKERRRIKERERKLRRKERLKGKERESEKRCSESKELSKSSHVSASESFLSAHEETHNTSNSGDSINETGDIMLSSPLSSDVIDEQSSNGCSDYKLGNFNDENPQHPCNVAGEHNVKDGNSSFMIKQSKSSWRKLRFKKDCLVDPASRGFDKQRSAAGNEYGGKVDESEQKLHGYMGTSVRCINGLHRQRRNNSLKPNARICGPKFSEKIHYSTNRMCNRCDFQACSCNLHKDYRARDVQYVPTIRWGRNLKSSNKSESALDMSRPYYRTSKFNHGCYEPDSCAVPKGKLATGNIPSNRGENLHGRKVWEPLESQKRCPRSNSDPDVTSRYSDYKNDACESRLRDGNNSGSKESENVLKSFGEQCLSEKSGKGDALNSEDGTEKSSNYSPDSYNGCPNGFGLGMKSPYCKKDFADDVGLYPVISTFPVDNSSDPLMSTSGSDNCSSCLSEGDSSSGSSGAQNAESLSASDSEDTSQHSEARENCAFGENMFHNCLEAGADGKYEVNGQDSFTSRTTTDLPMSSCMGVNFIRDKPTKNAHISDNRRTTFDMGSQHHHPLSMDSQGTHLPVFQAHSTMGYYHQNAPPLAAAPTNRLLPFGQPNHYMVTSSHGYGLPTNQTSHFCMHYGPLQHLTTPILNVGHLPLYQTANKANVMNSKDHTVSSKLGGAKEDNGLAAGTIGECSIEKSPANQQHAQKVPSPGQDGMGAPAKSHQKEGSAFSLFHFGGPVAVAAGYNVNPVWLKDEANGDFSSKPAPAPTQVDIACSKRETAIEEYSLFAASNGARFSFF